MAQAAAMGAVVAGGALQTKGILDEAQMQHNVGKYNAEIDRQNAQLAIMQSREDERKQRVYGRKALGDIRSGYAASGITMEGSAMDILEESAANAELDALSIRHGGYAKATAYRSQAQMAEYQGAEAMRAGRTKAAATILSTAGKAYGSTG
jgi:hypothetical protein